MARFTDREIVNNHGGVAVNAVEPEQQWLARYMQRNPNSTLAEARESRMPPKIGRADLADMAAHTPWEDLTPAQRKIVGGIPDKPVTVNDIAKHSGLDAGLIRKRMVDRKSGGINPSSLVFKSSRGFFGRTFSGGRKSVVFYVVRSTDDNDNLMFAFGTPAGIVKAIKDNADCISPPCDDNEEALVEIPLMDGEVRDNVPEDEREVAGG